MKNLIGKIMGSATISFMALSVLAQLNNTMELKISKNDRKKCRNCNNKIIKGQGYIEIPYDYTYQKLSKAILPNEHKKLNKIMGLFGKNKSSYENEMLLRRTKYTRYCSECLYWLFEKHLKGGYEDWLNKKVADKI